MESFLLKGFILGLSIAAPVGQIGVLCIRRTLAYGRSVGFVSGLGAATADAVYGCVAAFGLTAISAFLVSQQAWMRLLGGLFLIYLGVRIFLEHPAESAAPADRRGFASAYFSTFFLTLANPTTILSFAAIFVGLGVVASTGEYLTALALVCGVFIGSATWWFFLSGAISLFRRRLDTGWLVWVNRISGTILAVLGVASLASLAL